MASLSQGGILKQEGQTEEEELTKKTERRAERKVANLAFPLSFLYLPPPPKLRMEVPKK